MLNLGFSVYSRISSTFTNSSIQIHSDIYYHWYQQDTNIAEGQ